MKKFLGTKRWVRELAILLIAMLIAPLLPVTCQDMQTVHALEGVFSISGNSDPNAMSSNEDKTLASQDMSNYMVSLQIKYRLDEKMMENVYKVYQSAVYYMESTPMTVLELWNYVAQTKSAMDSAALVNVSATTSEFLMVGDNWSTPNVSYGQSVDIVLPIINFGTEELRDLIIEPVVSMNVADWPFVPDQTGYLQTEPFIPGNQTKEAAMNNRREFTFHFTARDDVMTGYYPLKFMVSYTKAGIRCEKPAELTVYVHTEGKPGSGYIGSNGRDEVGAKPRIIVTGFETDPADVFAGDTFTLTIHVQNTSTDTEVSNVLFDLQAAVEGEDKTNTYAAFLPTSGSSSIYMDKIGVNSTSDLVIEMTAKAGLAQKPYVLNVNMKYDAGSQFDLTDTASVSIPIHQESRFDTSIPEIAPADITVGEQSNVMFSIYNTGKTTLYNTQVKFRADSIDEASAFVGNLQSGATGNVDVMLNAIAPTMDDGTIVMEISFEDEGGTVTRVEKSITLMVTEAFYDDMGMGGMMEDPMMDEGVEQKPGKGKAIIITLIVVILAAVGGTTIFLRIKRKAKAAKELAEDLLFIEDDDQSDNE